MIVQVNLYNEPLGLVEWNNEKGSATFQYLEETLAKSIEPSPILMLKEERIFETNRNHANFHNLPYLLSDSMPDDFGNIMMKEWLRQKDLVFDDINPVERLTYVGLRGMGALEYEPFNHTQNNNYEVDVSELFDVAKNVLEGKKESTYEDLDEKSVTDILRIGTSVGGARAKALIAIKRDASNKIKEIRPGDIIQKDDDFTYWLLKIDVANQKTLGENDGFGKIEYAYYKIAKAAGIEISDSTLYEENNRFHFLTKRFDRTDKGEKIHMQTFGALAGIDFRMQKASSYETLFRVMKRLRINYQQFEQQYRRAIFNIIARNHDDHVKNFSFLMDKDGKWRISPAYDITYNYNPDGRWTSVHQSSINGKFDDFTRADLIEFGKKFGIKKAKFIIDEVIDAVAKWPSIAKEIEIPQDSISLIQNNHRLKIV